MKFRCSVLKCPSLKDRSPRESDIPASEEISFHTLPHDEPRRSKWLHFVDFANGGEREQKVVRVCSLHFRRSDYGRDPYVSSLLGHAAARRRLMYTAVPSVVPPGQPEYSEPSESHSATYSGLPSQEQPDGQGRFCVGTQTGHDVGNNKGVQAFIPGRNKRVQTCITVKEACDKTVRVESRDVRPAILTSVKRRHPEAHLPSTGVQTCITVKEACDEAVRVESRDVRPAILTSVKRRHPEAHLPSTGVQTNITMKEACDKTVRVESRDVRPAILTSVKRRHPEAHLPSTGVQTSITMKEACDKTVRVESRDVRPAKSTSVQCQYPEAHLPSPGVQTNITMKEACDKTVRVESQDVRPAKSTSVQCQYPEAHLPPPDVSPARAKNNASGTVYKRSLFYGFVEGVQVSIMVKEACYKAAQDGSRDVRPAKSTPVNRCHPEAHLPSPDVLPPRGKDNDSDTVSERGKTTLASESTLGKEPQATNSYLDWGQRRKAQ